MNKTTLFTILCASLMLITPLTSVAQENKISSNLQEEPDIDGLVAQLHVVIDEVLQRYGHILMVSNLCNVLLDILGWIGTIVFCIFLVLLVLPLILLFFLLLRLDIGSYSLIVFILFIFSITSRYCNPLNFLNFQLSHQSIFALSETIDSTNQLDDCLCLQE